MGLEVGGLVEVGKGGRKGRTVEKEGICDVDRGGSVWVCNGERIICGEEGKGRKGAASKSGKLDRLGVRRCCIM